MFSPNEPLGMESSFVAHLQLQHPELMPRHTGERPELVEATTITALSFADGVVMAGDRRATVGNRIASSHMEKVFAADSHSLIGVAGVAGIAVEMARLFAVELEHYEKLEGTQLSLLGKANRLAALIRNQLPQALQGISAVPVFAGVTPDTSDAKIFTYDITGGRFEERHWCSIGSGSPYASTTLKRLWRADATQDEALDASIQALIDAADADAGTAGPDPRRELYPTVYVVTGDGVRKIEETMIAQRVAGLEGEH
ncbi:MAG TPA: proteasome subunit beta [Enteractinococcus sp.]